MAQTQKTEVSLNLYNRTKMSINGRLRRLRSYKKVWDNYDKETPIQEIGVFQAEMDTLEITLINMKKRIDNAKITIEL